MSDKSRLDDVINYTPEAYFDDAELTLLRAHFNGAEGRRLLKAVRKCLISTISDSELPIEEFGKEAFLGQVNFKEVPDDQAKSIAFGIQLYWKAVMGGLIHLKQIANVKEETEQEKKLRGEKNSTK